MLKIRCVGLSKVLDRADVVVVVPAQGLLGAIVRRGSWTALRLLVSQLGARSDTQFSHTT